MSSSVVSHNTQRVWGLHFRRRTEHPIIERRGHQQDAVQSQGQERARDGWISVRFRLTLDIKDYDH